MQAGCCRAVVCWRFISFNMATQIEFVKICHYFETLSCSLFRQATGGVSTVCPGLPGYCFNRVSLFPDSGGDRLLYNTENVANQVYKYKPIFFLE